MSLDYKMRELINDLTRDVIENYGIKIPITDVNKIIKDIGGNIIQNEELSSYSDGFIKKNGEQGFEIVVSPHQQSNRLNFTIAHELGHLFLHMVFQTNWELWRTQKITYYRKGTSEEEYEANEFAAALLMPREKYKEVMERFTEGNAVDTAKIADYFHVSTNAASNRGKWLGYLEW